MEAITRREKIMSGENLTPITRKELFLAKAAGQDVQTPTPITREEYFLSKISGGSGTSGATAYTVSSVDELPTNAVDGSMAFVESDDILGGWYLNRILNLAEFDFYFKYKALDNNNEEWVVANLCTEFFDGESVLYYLGEDDAEVMVYSDTLNLKTWRGGNYRTIFITEIDDAEAEDWIRANGRKTKSLYTHENGEWVYKCEVA